MRPRLRSTLFLALLTGLGGCDTGAEGPGRGAASAPADSTPAADTAPVGPDADRGDRYTGLRREVCDTLRNSFDCARAIEARQLGGPGAAARSGDTLRLALAAGDTARFVDQPGDHAEVVYYSYQHRWPEAGYFLVQRQYYEGSDYLLVNDSTGARTVLPDWPLLGPDARRFAVLSLDLVAGYGPNALQVWAIQDSGPVLEWETEPSQWGPTDGRWLHPDTLRFIQHGYCEPMGEEGRGMCDRQARVYESGGNWHLEPTPLDPGG